LVGEILIEPAEKENTSDGHAANGDFCPESPRLFRFSPAPRMTRSKA